MSKVCSNCNTENIDEAKFCRKCGKQKFENNDKVLNSENYRTTQSNSKINNTLSSDGNLKLVKSYEINEINFDETKQILIEYYRDYTITQNTCTLLNLKNIHSASYITMRKNTASNKITINFHKVSSVVPLKESKIYTDNDLTKTNIAEKEYLIGLTIIFFIYIFVRFIV